MRNPELTKQTIIEKASKLFNRQGYKATSISDITTAAQLTKGAIYRHFEDKSDLEKEALKYMTYKMLQQISERIVKAEDAKGKLYQVLQYFNSYSKKPPFEGGCPLMNASVEADDTNPALKAVAKNIMMGIHKAIVKIITNGIKHCQIKPEVNASEFASVMISTLEGSVLMLKILDGDKHMKATIKFLEREVDRILV